jgi:nucleoside-diphosphate-sugar epimerase
MANVKPSDGPVAVTGGSGYIGSHCIIKLMQRGYKVRACLRDTKNPDKTEFLLALNKAGLPGNVELFEANLLNDGSYDEIFKDCCAVLHAGTPVAYANAYSPRQVYDGAINGTKNVFNSIKKSGTIKRVVYTSSFAAIVHPMKTGYVYTENDWGSENPDWDPKKIDNDHGIAYGMAKVEAEHMVNRIAEEDGRFDVISVNPSNVIGPLLSVVHELEFSWQWALGKMLENKVCPRSPLTLWNIVDVRDIGEIQSLIIESDVCKNGSRYMGCATDESMELDVMQLKSHLEKLFPNIKVGPLPDELQPILDKYGNVFQTPLAHCDKALKDLGLKTHKIEDTLRETGQTMIDLGLIKPIAK